MSEERKKLIEMVKTMDLSSLDKFDRGPLTDEEIAVGMHLSFVNARELYGDALLLYENERFGRTLSLLVLALEELGRIPVLLNAVFISQDDELSWRKFWALLRKHTLKQGVWTAYGKKLAATGHPHAPNFSPTLPQHEEPLLDKFKQCGFYVTCLEGHFLSPNMFARFDKRKIANLFEIVSNRIEGFKELHSSLLGSSRMVAQARESIKTWSEARLKKEVEEIFAEWDTARSKPPHRKTIH